VRDRRACVHVESRWMLSCKAGPWAAKSLEGRRGLALLGGDI
jgi:hypothetical protein